MNIHFIPNTGTAYDADCTTSEECTARDQHTECTGSPKKCLCITNYNYNTQMSRCNLIGTYNVFLAYSGIVGLHIE